MVKSNVLVTLTGPSCSGKTTLQEMMRKKGYNVITSFTTRPIRAGEVDGVDYQFIDTVEFDSLFDAGNQLAEHIYFNGNYYGITGEELVSKLSKGPTVVVVEPHGARQLAEYCRHNRIPHLSVFICHNSIVNAARFLERFRKDPNAKAIDYANRMYAMFTEEREWIHAFPYNHIYNSFDSSTENRVLSEVLAAVDNMVATPEYIEHETEE